MGIDRTWLQARAGLRDKDLQDPDARVPVSSFVELWRELLRARPEPDLGIRFGAVTHAQQLGLIGYLMMHSVDLEGALGRLVRFCRLLSEANRARLTEAGAVATFSWEPDARLQRIPQAIDWALAAVVNVVEELTAAKLEPREILYPYPKPAGRKAKLGGPRTRARFDCPRPALVLASRDLRRPVTDADTTLGSYLEDHAETVLAALPSQRSASRRTRAAIWRRLRAGEPTLERVARELSMGPRTLQRRLSEEGTSFSVLLEELRRALATTLLEDRSLPVHEIAFLLGYSEPSAFYRAFRRWRRVSPGTYRVSN